MQEFSNFSVIGLPVTAPLYEQDCYHNKAAWTAESNPKQLNMRMYLHVPVMLLQSCYRDDTHQHNSNVITSYYYSIIMYCIMSYSRITNTASVWTVSYPFWHEIHRRANLNLCLGVGKSEEEKEDGAELPTK